MRSRRFIIPIAFVAVAAAVLLVAWNPFASRPAAADSSAVEHAVARFRDYFTVTFIQSRLQPLREGDAFPEFELPVVQGTAPDWSRPTVITLGGPTASSAIELFQKLQDVDIQKVHIYSTGVPTTDSARQFPGEVIILDGVQPTDGLNIGISPQLSEALGIFRGSSAYLLGEDGTILYAHLNHADYGDVEAAVRQLQMSGPSDVTRSAQIVLQVGDTVDLSTLPPEVGIAVERELTKPLAVVYFLDEAACEVFVGLPQRAQSYTDRWASQGIGVILINSGQQAAGTELSSAGVLTVFDGVAPEGSTTQLADAWGIATLPLTLILSDGTYQGTVPYAEIEIDGVQVREVQFEAVNEILTTTVKNLDGM